MKWVEDREEVVIATVGLAVVVDAASEEAVAPTPQGQAVSACVPVAGSASRIPWACHATRKSVPNAAHR
jgi:hypothetical protein